MEFNATKYTRICAFSPTFDSTNLNFHIQFGITSHFSPYMSSLYTTNFEKADVTIRENQIEKYTVNGAYFILFASNFSEETSFPSDTFHYRRETEVKSDISFEDFCQMNFMAVCNSSGCVRDQSNFVSWSCSNNGSCDEIE